MTEHNAPAPPSMPEYTLETGPQRSQSPTASLILGIIALVANVVFVPTILGLTFGIRGLRVGEDEGARRRSVWGIVLSSVGTLSPVVTILLVRAMAE